MLIGSFFRLFLIGFLCIVFSGALSAMGGEVRENILSPRITSSGSSGLEKIQIQKKKQSFSLSTRSTLALSDSHIRKYLSRTHSLDRQEYVPRDLVSISHPAIGEAGRKDLRLRKEAAEALWRMAIDFHRHFSTQLVVISAYRSYEYQQWMWDIGHCTPVYCAPAGHSEHQLGLAIDIFDATTREEYMSNPKHVQYIDWLQKHAHLYGYHQSYQKGVEIDEYEIEPWHWRYLGVEMASRLHTLGWTYAEYVEFEESLKWLKR